MPPQRPRRALTQGQKAAVIVRLLVSGGADPGIATLPRDQQRRLVADMAGLRFVDRATLAATVAEFASELDAVGLHFPRELNRVLDTLQGRLSLDVIEALIAESGGDAGNLGQAAWDGVAGLDLPILTDMMAGESDEVCAILLSKLPPAKAAQLLAELDDSRADAVAAAFGRTEDVTPDTVSRIGTALGRQSGARAALAFDSAPVMRVGAILNAATSRLRRALLDRLDETDPAFAARVRAAVFSYENIPDRLDPRDAPRVLRAVETPVIVAAFAGAPADQAHVAEFLLAAISSRLADQLREEVEEIGPITPDAAEEAMSGIVAAIRTLEEAGELTLLTSDV